MLAAQWCSRGQRWNVNVPARTTLRICNVLNTRNDRRGDSRSDSRLVYSLQTTDRGDGRGDDRVM